MIALTAALAALLFLLLFPFRIRVGVMADLLKVEAGLEVRVLVFRFRRRLVYARGEFYLCRGDTAERLLLRSRPSPAREALKRSLTFGGGRVALLTGQEDLAAAVQTAALLQAAGGVLTALIRAPFSAQTRMEFTGEPVLLGEGSAVLFFRLGRFLGLFCAGVFRRLCRRHARQSGLAGA